MLPISAMERLQWAFSISITWLQNTSSSNSRQPRYSEPSWEISRKQRLGGCIADRKTALRVPTSPLGRWFSNPSVQDQTGGQLGRRRYVISGCSRSNTALEPPCRVQKADFWSRSGSAIRKQKPALAEVSTQCT